MEQASRRSKRARVAVDYARLESTGFSDCIRVQHKRLARAVLKFEEQPPVDNYRVDYVAANELGDHVHSTGFRNPFVVRASAVPPCGLGIRLPVGELSVERIADLVGRNRQINTIDVTTQSEGPIFTMQEWVEYFAAPSPRKPLLNVVSLDLENTSLQAMVSAPSLVKELDLVDKAWPASVSPSPKVQLYTLMSVAGCFMDFHIDFGGSSVWYHVLSGRKVFLVIPPIRGNLMAFEEWASSDRQASVFFADRASGCQKVELGAGDTLLLPGGWPHCVVTPIDSVVLGGNFLAGYNLSLQLDIWQMEERLKVRSKFRFPFYKELMCAEVCATLYTEECNLVDIEQEWHTASTYLKLLKEESDTGDCKVTKWERDGMQSLTRLLGFWLSQMKEGNDVPKEIPQPGNSLVEDLAKYIKKSDNAPLDPSACARTRIVLKSPTTLQDNITQTHLVSLRNSIIPLDRPKYFQPDHAIHHFDDSDEDFDPGEESEDYEDEDFKVDEAKMCQDRAKSKKLLRRTRVNLSAAQNVNSSSPQLAGAKAQTLTKSSSDVRQRLLKNCGFDPRIPIPSPNLRPK